MYTITKKSNLNKAVKVSCCLKQCFSTLAIAGTP